MSLLEWLRPTGPTASPEPPRSRLTPFPAVGAALVVQWVTSDAELFELAPGTPPPLTPEKVNAWRREDGHPLFYHEDGGREPCGYVELNPFSFGSGNWWIGHCLVAPAARARGVGSRMLAQVLDLAFLHHNACSVSLVVFPANLGAIRCYRRAGFAPHGEVFRQSPDRPDGYHLFYMSVDRRTYTGRRHGAVAQDLPVMR